MPKKEMWSTEVAGTERADRGAIRRGNDPLAHPELGMDGCRTLYEGLRRGQQVSPLGPCMGFRAVSTSGLATPYIYSSYNECVARVDCIAAGLERLNLLPKNEDGMILLGIYMKNCMEWVLCEHGVFALGGTTVPFYDTLGHTTVQFILTQTGTPSVVCSRAELPRLCEAKMSGQCPSFRSVILIDGVVPEAAKMADDAALEIISLAKVEAVGAQVIATEGHKHNPPSGKDVATFCYTSGTTGNPKGALITHENLISAMAGMQRNFKSEPFDRHISYLPLPHIFERCVLEMLLIVGGSIGFSRGDPKLLIEDIQGVLPTGLPVVPRVLSKIYDKIMNGVEAAGGFKKRLFEAALTAKLEGLKKGRMKHALYDRLVFNKIKKALGFDQVRFMVSGSAPLSAPVMMFFRCVLGVPVVEGYGQTEGAAAATVGHPDDQLSAGHVGGPTDCAEIVLMDVPEMGYLHTDKTHRGIPCMGRGEICVRGPNVFKGYYKQEDKTRETVDEEGWLHSGDIGLWTMQGQLMIIDRKKNIFKLSQGEYVAPEKIENILTPQSLLIAQTFVYGNSFQSTLVAIIVPDDEAVAAWASSNGMDSMSFPGLCRSKELKQAVMADIKEISKKNKLTGFETVRAIYLDHEPFSSDNGLMTPTFKLKRQQLRDHYQKQIDEMYASMPPPKSKL